jgi:potassium/hydrogen antiporter
LDDPVQNAQNLGVTILVVGMVVLAAVFSNRLSERTRIPAPVLFLVCAAVASDLYPRLYSYVPAGRVEQAVTVALVVVLFDGGMGIGRRRFRSAALPIIWLGVVGTVLTTGAMCLLAHTVSGLSWRTSLLLGTALSPTDPAVVFSVLGRRSISGRTGTILEGESGANDPVGIALMVALLGAGGSTGSQIGHVVGTFALQIVVGSAVGAAGGFALLWSLRHVPVVGSGLYPVRALAGAMVVYGAADVAHGSGFLAVLVAGVLIGDESMPYRPEIRQVCHALSNLAEIVVFVVLGLTINLHQLVRDGALATGLALAALLAFVVRPLLITPLLLAFRMRAGERVFVAWAGLKGAVPILLGSFALSAGQADARQVYEIVFVVVAFSVLVQGGSVEWAAQRLGVPMSTVRSTPWALGVRLPHEPRNTRMYVVEPGSETEGAMLGDVIADGGPWVSVALREGHLLPMTPGTVLRAGDEILLVEDDGPVGDGDAPDAPDAD